MLTDVGDVSWTPGAPASSWDRALLSLALPGDTCARAMGTASRCSNSQGDARRRAMSCGEALGRARGPQSARFSPASLMVAGGNGSTCSRETDRGSSSSVERGEPTSAGSESAVTEGEASGLAAPRRSRLSESGPQFSAGPWWAPTGEAVHGWGVLAANSSCRVFSSELPPSSQPGSAPAPGCSPDWAWPPAAGSGSCRPRWVVWRLRTGSGGAGASGPILYCRDTWAGCVESSAGLGSNLGICLLAADHSGGSPAPPVVGVLLHLPGGGQE